MKSIWIRAKHDLPNSTEVQKHLAAAFSAAGFRVDTGYDRMPEQKPGLCVCLGGDGTLLSTVRLLGKFRYDVPILGVHTSAGLGFLHSISAAQTGLDHVAWAREFVTAIKKSDFTIEDRWGLDAMIGGGKQASQNPHWALNDVVISKGPLSRMIYIQVSVNDSILLQRLRGDGLIVSTATGSTGYSLSAGGPVVHPTLNTLLVTPICPHEVAQRPVLLDGHAVIRIESLVHRNASYITFDGQEVLDLEAGQTVQIQRAERPLKWVAIKSAALKPSNFYERLKSKLGYGGDIGNVTGT